MISITLAAIHDLSTKNGMGANVGGIKKTWVKPIEVVKEPEVCSALRNLLFAFPGRGFLCFGVKIFVEGREMNK